MAIAAATTLSVGFAMSAAPWGGAAPHAGGSVEGRQALVSPTDDKGYYDARQGDTATSGGYHADLSVSKASTRPQTERLRQSLGLQADVDIDAMTGTPRMVARLDGYLSAPSSRPAANVAMGYVRAHLAALGLTADDLSTFQLRRDYVDIAGTSHLSWTQSVGGIPVFGNGLQAAVTKDGRLLTIGGSPISGLSAPSASRVRSDKVASATAAIAAARADVAEPPAAGPEDSAEQVLFAGAGGTRLAWQTITMSASRPMLSVVDARSGRILHRQDLSDDANPTTSDRAPVSPAANRADSTGARFLYFPGHRPRGGVTHFINFTKRGWLTRKATTLRGNNSWAFADTNDDNLANKHEEIRPSSPHRWGYELKPFHLKRYSFCDNPFPCSWNPNKAFSWRTNRNQNAEQVFFFVNNWHDHLMAAPIGFTEAAGNFQRINSTKQGVGHDAVRTQTDDGANTDHGLPDTGHIDNANMGTPPDGHAPRMQMYLQHQPFTSYPDGDPFSPTNVGDEADTVYHEYTHGLSNRLVVDATGVSTLGPVQAGAMGEAWSDWYAMDYLVDKGLERDKPRSGDVVMFQYDGFGDFLDRTEAIDCAVGERAPRCTGGATGHNGGYTYADYGHVIGVPEVHSDGEIWTQTLWDLRGRLGSRISESLVTRAMELSPSNPSFLDERNAILLADLSVYGGRHQAAIWRVFAHRGIGYYAGSFGGNDTAPGASFRVPPTDSAVGSISGRVTDRNTGSPLQGAVVSFAFEGSPFVTNPSTVTNAQGRYTLGPLPVGHYPKLEVSYRGYDRLDRAVNVRPGTGRLNVSLRKDWVSLSGGAKVVSATGSDFSSIGCGPSSAIDQSDASGWAVEADLVNGQAGPKTPKKMVVKLPQSIDIDSVTLNPSTTCGLGQSASTGGYRIETSGNGSAWTLAHEGTFVAADMGHPNTIPLDAGTTGVRFVRLTITEPLVLSDTATYGSNPCPGAFSGCDYESTTELEVYGQ